MNVPVVGHWPFVYLSWTTLTTLGSGYTFTGTAARTLAMVDVASGIGMLAVVLSIFVLGAIRVRADLSSDLLMRPVERRRRLGRIQAW